MAGRRKLNNRLKALLDQYDDEVQAAFLLAVRRRAGNINMSALIKAIEARDMDRALRMVSITRADLYPVDAAITSAYTAGGQTISAAAPSFAVQFGFDGRATRAAEWALRRAGGLVTDIVTDQENMLKSALSAQLAAGYGPRKVAIRIAGPMLNGRRRGGIIGLSRPQVDYLDSARRELTELDKHYFSRKLRDRRFDPLVRRAIGGGKALSQTDIDRVAGRYSDRMLKHRGNTIARSENITALRAGRREGVMQGIEAGAIKPNNMERFWSATLDPRTRDDHASMDGQSVVGMDEPFTAPDGSQMRYPGDTSLGASAKQTILCRCYDEYKIDWLRG